MRTSGRLLIIAALAVTLTGCGATPAEYRSQREIPEGPGMFSGDDGDFTLIRDGRPVRASEPEASPSEADFREFQRFQAYQEWKETAQETGEYEEFRNWLRWREYRRWQESR